MDCDVTFQNVLTLVRMGEASQTVPAEALVSVRLVVVDHYMAPPLPTLDPLVSDFRGYNVKKVLLLLTNMP